MKVKNISATQTYPTCAPPAPILTCMHTNNTQHGTGPAPARQAQCAPHTYMELVISAHHSTYCTHVCIINLKSVLYKVGKLLRLLGKIGALTTEVHTSPETKRVP